MAFSYTDIKNALEQASKKTGGKFLSFDASYYQAHYSEVRDAGGALLDDSLKNYTGDPLQHYVELGAAKGYAPNAHFDAAFYKSQYADLAPFSGADLLAHYALFGAYEGRAPTAILQAFDGARYLKDYPDVEAYVNANLADFLGSVTNGAIAHYVLFGASEQRKGYTTSGLDVDNHAPTVPASQNIAVDAGKPYVFKPTDFPFADVDPNDRLEQVELVSAPSAGSLKLGATTLAAGALVTRAQLDGGQLSYVPAVGVIGQQSFDFRVMDQFNRSDAARLKLDVVSNHAPTTHDVSLTLNKNVLSLVLKASDFPFADVDSGDSLKAIVISTTPDKGVLKLNRQLVTSGSNTQVSLQQLNEGKLVFLTPLTGSVWEGLAAFEFKVLDQSDASATGKVQVTVGNVAPTTQAAQVSIEKNQAYTFKTTDFPFSDANGDALGGVQVISLPGLGSLKLNGASVTVGQTIAPTDLTAGKLVYTPDVDYNGLQSFNFQVKDAALNSGTAAMTLVVGNRAPTTGAGSVSLVEDASYVFKQADFPFTDADGNTLAKLELSSLPVDGQLRLNGVAQVAGAQISVADLDAGKLTYVPAANVNGARSFDFKVWDQQAASSAAKMTLTVTPVNDAPTTAAAKAVTPADTAYVFKAADFPFSDVDPGDSLQAVVLGSLPGNGVLSLDGAAVTGGTVVTAAQLGAGLLRYTPTTGFNGKTSFDFRVKDAALESGSASFALSVGNQAPVTKDKGLAVPDLAYVFKTVDFPFQDENIDDSLQAIVIGGLPANGNLKLDGAALKAGDTVSRAQLDAGKLVYSTATAFTGQVSFGFQVKDAALSSNSATMTLNVGNHAPTTLAASVTAAENTGYVFKLADFQFADADAGDRLEKVEIVSLPVGGQLKLTGGAVIAGAAVTRADIEGGKLSYVPETGFNGSVTFDFKVDDLSSSSAAAKMTVIVTPVNEAPVTSNKQVAAIEDVTYVFKLADFPFTDGDGDKLGSVVIDSLPGSGQLQFGSAVVKAGDVIAVADLDAGKLKFVPTANANGNVSFNFKVRDAELSSNVAAMTLAVAAVQDAPVAKTSTVTAQMGKTYAFAVKDFGFQDVDSSDSLQSVKIVSLPDKGNMLLNGAAVTAGTVVSKANLDAGKLTYTQTWPEPSSFSFSVNDGHDDSKEGAMMNISVKSSLLAVSKHPNGFFVNGNSFDPDMSNDGRFVVFQSDAPGLSANSTAYDGIYLHDVLLGTTTLISAPASGHRAVGSSANPTISANGERVLFASVRNDLVEGDTNNTTDVFMYNNATHSLVRVSESPSHVQADGASTVGMISGNGKFAVFSSIASNLLGSNSPTNVSLAYLKDLDSGGVLRLSNGIAGGSVDASSDHVVVSYDGSVAAFDSDATNLVQNDANAKTDVFVWKNSKISLASCNKDGVIGNGSSRVPLLTDNGEKVAFSSYASNLIGSDNNGNMDVFIKNLVSGEVLRVSESSSGQEATGASTLLSVSADGRYVAFASTATNLVTGDTNGKMDIFVKDMITKALVCISVNDAGVQGNGDSQYADLSGDGAFIAFSSSASNLVSGDTNGSADVFWGAWGS